jgi:glutamate synthase (NADPH/NADH) small chain
MMLRSSTSHEEGGIRDWSVATKRFTGDGEGNVKRIHTVRVDFGPPDAQGHRPMREIPGTEAEIDCDLVLLALGFVHPAREGLLTDLGLELNERGNVAVDEDYMTSRRGVFAAGDMSRGQSLVVWAIADGRKAARAVDRHLMGSTVLK